MTGGKSNEQIVKNMFKLSKGKWVKANAEYYLKNFHRKGRGDIISEPYHNHW